MPTTKIRRPLGVIRRVSFDWVNVSVHGAPELPIRLQGPPPVTIYPATRGPPYGPPWAPKGVRAGPGTPRDPKTHLFVTNRVAIPPFLTSGPGFYAEFRRGSRQGGPTPSISICF